MVADVIDGKALAKKVRQECSAGVRELAKLGCQPGLALSLAGNDLASQVYAHNKMKACTEIGLDSELYRFSGNSSEALVLAKIERLNVDDPIHGLA